MKLCFVNVILATLVLLLVKADRDDDRWWNDEDKSAFDVERERLYRRRNFNGKNSRNLRVHLDDDREEDWEHSFEDESDSHESSDSDQSDDYYSDSDESSDSDENEKRRRGQNGRGRRFRAQRGNKRYSQKRHQHNEKRSEDLEPSRQRPFRSGRGYNSKRHWRDQREQRPRRPYRDAPVELSDIGGIRDVHKPALEAARGRRGYRKYDAMLDRVQDALQGHIQIGRDLSFQWDFSDMFGRRGGQWWKGPNVCTSESEEISEVEEKSEECIFSFHLAQSSTICDESQTSYKCTTSLTVQGKKRSISVTYECCYGFTREPGEIGCTQEISLEDTLSTLNNLNLTQLVSAATRVPGLVEKLQEGNFSIFAPTNDAFISAFPQLDESYSRQGGVLRISQDEINMAKEIENILAAHLVYGFVKSSDIENEQKLKTANPGADIRINKYAVPKNLLTANCKPLESVDNFATDGIVHTVTSVLLPVEESLFDVIRRKKELSTLTSVLKKTGLAQVLSKRQGSFTLFAPSNDAFSKIDGDTLSNLLAGEKCLKNVLQEHLLPHVICSSAIEGQVRTLNNLENFLHFKRTEADEVLVEQAKIVKADIMGVNGVMHIIDSVLVPDDALNIADIAKKIEATAFLELVNQAGLQKAVRNLNNVTIFVPTNEAIAKLPPNALSDMADLSKILSYHIIQEELTEQQLKHGTEFKTLGSDKTVQIRDFSSFPFSMKSVKTVQCSPLKITDIVTCNGIIHLVDEVLMPPVGNVLDILQQNSQFSTLVGLLKSSGLADQLQLTGPFTIFAPTNKAFDKLDPEALQLLTSEKNKEILKGVLLHHIMRDSLCCSGVFNTVWAMYPKEHTLDGSTVLVSRDRADRVSVNRVEISHCDLSADNGVVHVVDDIIPEAVDKYTGLKLELLDKESERSPYNLKINLHDMLDNLEFVWPRWMYHKK